MSHFVAAGYGAAEEENVVWLHAKIVAKILLMRYNAKY